MDSSRIGQRDAIYNPKCCMSSAPFGHTTDMQDAQLIRLDIAPTRLYRALTVRFVMIALS